MNPFRFRLSRLLALALLAASFPVLALVTTAANTNIDLYERAPNNPQGTPSETSGIVTLSQDVTPGYVVLMETGDPTSTTDQNNQANWGDVLVFGEGNLLASQAQLLSDGATFPAVDTVNGAAHSYLLETQQGTGFDDVDTTLYVANPFNYFVHSAAPNCDGMIGTPDPATTGAATPLAAPSPCPTPVPSPSPTASASASPASGAGPASVVPVLPGAGRRPGSPLGPYTNPLRLPALITALLMSVLVMGIGGYRYRVRN